MNTNEIREELRKQGVLDIVEEHGCAMNGGDWCSECNTHKHICGHEKAVVLCATENFITNYTGRTGS